MALTPRQDGAGAMTQGAHAERPDVRVDIGELVLTGFPTAQRHNIGDAVQAELTRLIAERGMPPRFSRLANSDRIDGGAFRVPRRNASAALVGQRIAAVVYRSLARAED
jgi:hypothetical protein